MRDTEDRNEWRGAWESEASWKDEPEGTSVLGYEDVLTEPDAIQFWEKYFIGIRPPRKVKLEVFMRRVEEEFGVGRKTAEEVGRRVSVDGRAVSLLAVEGWTREAGGLEQAVLTARDTVAHEKKE